MEKISSLPEVSHLVLVGTWSFFKKKITLFLFYLCLCCVFVAVWACLYCGEWGYSSCMCEHLVAVVSLVSEQSSRVFGLQELWYTGSGAVVPRLWSTGSIVVVLGLSCMWDLQHV